MNANSESVWHFAHVVNPEKPVYFAFIPTEAIAPNNPRRVVRRETEWFEAEGNTALNRIFLNVIR